ncbi:MAG: acyl-CoA dehydrogenase family protein [Alphaproteobacteria bacterium]|nr:acyl-CoA dehydrogenase family protein [Alphaproteobacteria bacterium]
MSTEAPIDVSKTRRELLSSVEDIADTLTAQAPIDEAHNTLSPESVKILEDAGMFRLKLPAELGGAEADPTTQMLVLEALAYASSAASWCAMVGSTSVGLPGAFLPDTAIAEMFPSGHIPLGAVVAMPIGKTEIVDGGYLLSGRWPFASGVRHSEWIGAGAIVVRDGTPERRMMVFPTASVELHDNWQVAGLKGTGSCDFSVDGLFVQEAFTWNLLDGVQNRGGPVYQIGHPGFVANEHAGFALGVARRALDAFTEREAAKKRGYTGKLSSLSARPAVQRMLGAGDLKLRAARSLAIELNDAAYQAVVEGGRPSTRLQGELRAIASYCTEVALEVVTDTFRYSGGGAIYQQNILQQCLRDMNVAAQHLMVSEIAYENLGQMMLGVPDVNPMQ